MLTVFYMNGCPYCAMARKAVDELQRENSAFAGVQLKWIEERSNAALAAQYDYYYVPSVFDGTKKLYEADPSQNYESIKASMRQALEAAC